MQYWPFSKPQLVLSPVQIFHCLPSTVHFASEAALDDDNLLDELLVLDGAMELGAMLDKAVLEAGFDAGVDAGVDDPPPPPPPQAVNANAMLK
jgi:hypothetical protein